VSVCEVAPVGQYNWDTWCDKLRARQMPAEQGQNMHRAADAGKALTEQCRGGSLGAFGNDGVNHTKGMFRRFVSVKLLVQCQAMEVVKATTRHA
jgi:hypothetical protein